MGGQRRLPKDEMKLEKMWELVDQWEAVIQKHVNQYHLPHDEAYSLLNEVKIGIVEKYSHWYDPGRAKFSTILFRIIRRETWRAFNRLYGKKRQCGENAALCRAANERPQVYHVDVDDHIDGNLLMEKCRGFLSKEDMDLLEMRFNEHLFQREIAKKLGVSTQRVEAKLKSLYEKIRRRLKIKKGG